MSRRPKICFELTSLAYPIRLEQNGIDNFNVIYGGDIKNRLSYGDAAKNLGIAIMHALACDSKLDNRERGEK